MPSRWIILKAIWASSWKSIKFHHTWRLRSMKGLKHDAVKTIMYWPTTTLTHMFHGRKLVLKACYFSRIIPQWSERAKALFRKIFLIKILSQPNSTRKFEAGTNYFGFYKFSEGPHTLNGSNGNAFRKWICFTKSAWNQSVFDVFCCFFPRWQQNGLTKLLQSFSKWGVAGDWKSNILVSSS